ncbi:hypothetical protein ACFQGT_07340 [Natrialbaceae archaeon GCM10025810]|uniref:hypothetical protein n=1 Tax=Halovalidus salilacus TaxID=3075124 RepID=UPI0036146578
MLRAIFNCGDEATTTEIRDMTGLSNSQVAYRREKLREYGLIDVRTGEPTGSRTPPKCHSLTPSAQSHIEAGLFDLYNPPVTSDVEQLSSQVNHLRDRIDELDETITLLEERLQRLQSTLNLRVGNHAEVHEATDGEKIVNVITELQATLADIQEEVTELDERKKDKFLR